MPNVFYIPSGSSFYYSDEGVQTPLGIAVGVFVTPAIRTESSSYTIVDGDGTILVDTLSGNVTITMPSVLLANNYYNIKKIDTSGNKVIIVTPGSETIDGDAQVEITTQYESLQLITDGSNWFVI